MKSPEEIAHTLLCRYGLKSGLAEAQAQAKNLRWANPVLSSYYAVAADLLAEMRANRNNAASTNPA